jgi:hypothetical protein
MDQLQQLVETLRVLARTNEPSEFLHDIPNFEGSRDPSRAFFSCAIASSQDNQCKISKIKLAISTMVVTPATESTNACVAAW